ncbi:hypothetical protein TNCV_1598241 [Trichonephila clavipes]|nr:hypothetical protein TNCV_1598241 [Trichonephila clavipes]
MATPKPLVGSQHLKNIKSSQHPGKVSSPRHVKKKKLFENHPVGGADVHKSKKQCITNEQKTFTILLHQNMFHMTTTTGEKTFQTSDKSSNGRVQHVRMYGRYFSADRIFQFRQT